MNFDKLPKDIKRIIFDFNRAEAVERTKTVFSNIVLNELLDAFTKVTYDDDGEYEAEINHHDYRVALSKISRKKGICTSSDEDEDDYNYEDENELTAMIADAMWYQAGIHGEPQDDWF
eukprot:COSAG06_NODE_6008_length_3158_cov_2.217391_4_plen_118_part_00